MREIKDTLGIKYNKYTDIYKADNEQLGLLLKYIMWEFGKDVILSDVSELTRKRIEKKSKEIEEQIEELLEDDEFERVFNSLTQQIKRSHKSWQQLKDNIENKKKDNTTPTTPTETPPTPTETPPTPTETPTETPKAKTETPTETPKAKTEKVETTETATETTTETTTETAETEENENDYEFDEENVYFYNDSLHQIETVGFTQEQVAIFLYKNKERFDLPIKDISIVLNEMMSC